ncbi:Dynein regulatory complex protein 11 [Bulinus truncatus]|nr:Dynein regulatory complex protein 11 [Bulinus truncatus]
MENGKWKTITRIDQLVEKLKELEDYNDVPKLLQGTSHLDSGWQEYAFWSDKESYSRNLIHEEKDKFQLFLICWQPGKGNDPHKHLDSRCFFKVLYGKIVEKFHREVKSDLSQKTDKEYETGEVCDMGDCKDFHSITNPIKHSRAVTLHVYIRSYTYMIHPQKRQLVKTCLSGIFTRILELKDLMVEIEDREFHFFDDVLQDLNLTPDNVELPIPRYFREERIEVLKNREHILLSILQKFDISDRSENLPTHL